MGVKEAKVGCDYNGGLHGVIHTPSADMPALYDSAILPWPSRRPPFFSECASPTLVMERTSPRVKPLSIAEGHHSNKASSAGD